MARSDSTPKRCAIYTRKSSEEGLKQNFNSLHAQRQACEAFVKSQAGEGWRLVEASARQTAVPARLWSDRPSKPFSPT